jgi:hypothetical protein
LAVEDARAAAGAVETRTLRQGPDLSGDPKTLFLTVKRCLIAAADDGVLRNPINRILSLVKLEERPRREGRLIAEIIGGATLDKGQATDEFFVRSDGARISFAVTVASRADLLVIPAYRFHLRFPSGMIPPYVRFDLNYERSDPLAESRCHVHVGADDLRVATPLMAPVEILTKLLYGLPCHGNIPSA